MSQISDFYRDKTILITGATGFLGKVLLERMLSTLTDVRRIYLLLRPKKNLTPDERVKKLLSDKIFTFNQIPTSQLEKIDAIGADICKRNLDLRREDREKILNEVSVVIHMAANVRFDLPLRDAIMQNTLATRTILELCLQMKSLVSVVYVSTTFCNIDIPNCEEKVYDIKGVNPYDLLEMLNEGDKLNEIEKFIIKPHPNTYTFTKRLAEIVARDLGETLPLSIVRPSIIFPAWKQPDPGWVDSMNGPVGLVAGMISGITRMQYVNTECEPDIVAVDCVANAIIAASTYKTLQRNKDTPVYNVTMLKESKSNWGFMGDVGMRTAMTHPFKQLFWYPSFFCTSSYLYYVFWTILCHFLPGYILDRLLILFGRKPFYIDVYKRIWYGNKVLSFVTLSNFNFKTKRTEELFSALNTKDQDQFYGLLEHKADEDFIRYTYFGVRKWCLKDDGKSYDSLYILNLMLQAVTCYLIAWITLYFMGETKLLRIGYWTQFYSKVNIRDDRVYFSFVSKCI